MPFKVLAVTFVASLVCSCSGARDRGQYTLQVTPNGSYMVLDSHTGVVHTLAAESGKFALFRFDPVAGTFSSKDIVVPPKVP